LKLKERRGHRSLTDERRRGKEKKNILPYSTSGEKRKEENKGRSEERGGNSEEQSLRFSSQNREGKEKKKTTFFCIHAFVEEKKGKERRPEEWKGKK